jgi:hypothetical protein
LLAFWPLSIQTTSKEASLVVRFLHGAHDNPDGNTTMSIEAKYRAQDPHSLRTLFVSRAASWL